MPDQYYQDAETRMATRLGRIRREQEQRKREELAAAGAGYGGRRTAAMRQVERDISDLELQGTDALERNRMLMEESQRGRTWQTGERTGTQSWQTGERLGGQDWQSGMQQALFGHQSGMQQAGFGHESQMQQGLFGHQAGMQQAGFGHERGMSEQQHQQQLAQMGAGFGYQSQLAEQGYGHDIGRMGAQYGYSSQLQGQAEAAAQELQRLVQSGEMTQLEAEQAWQYIQNEEQRGHETGMQNATIAQDQWMAEFGQDAAMALQNDTQGFEDYLIQQGRGWELTDREYNQQMWLLDAQLQMAIAGWDWDDDGYIGGGPAFAMLTAEEMQEQGLNPWDYVPGSGYPHNPAGDSGGGGSGTSTPPAGTPPPAGSGGGSAGGGTAYQGDGYNVQPDGGGGGGTGPIVWHPGNPQQGIPGYWGYQDGTPLGLGGGY